MTTPTHHNTDYYQTGTTLSRLLVLAEREGHACAAREIHHGFVSPRINLTGDKASIKSLIPNKVALDEADIATLHTRYQAAYYAAWELQLTPDDHDDTDDTQVSRSADSDTTAATPVDGDTTHTTA